MVAQTMKGAFTCQQKAATFRTCAYCGKGNDKMKVSAKKVQRVTVSAVRKCINLKASLVVNRKVNY